VTWNYREVAEQDRIVEAQESAAAAAERAAAAVLAFSHDSLDADLAKAQRFLSPTSYDDNPAFRDLYTETFTSDARPRAIETKATVTANVLASAVVTATEERAQILVYVDQTTTSTVNGGRPQVALNRTTFDMVNEDGSWLVAGITSY
jgi:Mce-associated membrane protein